MLAGSCWASQTDVFESGGTETRHADKRTILLTFTVCDGFVLIWGLLSSDYVEYVYHARESDG